MTRLRADRDEERPDLVLLRLNHVATQVVLIHACQMARSRIAVSIAPRIVR
jgi:hypothetical protein